MVISLNVEPIEKNRFDKLKLFTKELGGSTQILARPMLAGNK